MKTELTHKKLVKLAAKWLAKKYPVVVTEIATEGEEPDAIGFNGRESCLIECKASRADFMTDAKKPSRRPGRKALGSLRYYLVEDGLINVDDLPPAWGLLVVRYGIVIRDHFPHALHGQARDMQAESMILLSLIRRIGQKTPQGVSIRCYTINTHNRTTLGVKVDEPR